MIIKWTVFVANEKGGRKLEDDKWDFPETSQRQRLQ